MKPTTTLVTLALILLTITPSKVTSSISCFTVYSDLSPCQNYVGDTTQSVPSQECCNGVNDILSSCKTRADRQSVCKCIKSVTSTSSGPTYTRAVGIPAACGSTFQFNPNECSK